MKNQHLTQFLHNAHAGDTTFPAEQINKESIMENDTIQQLAHYTGVALQAAGIDLPVTSDPAGEFAQDGCPAVHIGTTEKNAIPEITIAIVDAPVRGINGTTLQPHFQLYRYGSYSNYGCQLAEEIKEGAPVRWLNEAITKAVCLLVTERVMSALLTAGEEVPFTY